MSLPITQIKNISPVDTRAYELAAQAAANRPSIFGNLTNLVNQGEQAFASERANNVRDLIRHGVLGGLTPEEALGQVRNDSRFSNNDFENAKVDDLMKGLNNEWRAKNADARSAEELKLRQNEDARTARLMLQKEEANRLVAEFTEFTDGTPEAARAFLDRNKTRLTANPLAYNLVTQAAKQGGMSMASYSQDDPSNISIPITEEAQKQLDALNVALRTLASTGNIEQLLDDKGNLLSESSDKVLKELIDQYGYKDGDAENFSDNFWKAYNKVKAANPFLSDAMIAGMLRRNVESRGWTGPWRVNDWDVGLFNNILEETAKKIGNPNKTIAKYGRMLTQRDQLQDYIGKNTLTNVNAINADKIKRVKANVAAGLLTEQEGNAILKRITATTASQLVLPIKLLQNALLDSVSVIPNEKDETKAEDKK